MNSLENNTGSAAKPARKDLYDLFENPISDAVRMISILQKLVEDALREDLEPIFGKRGVETYNILRSERDDIYFALYQSRDFVCKIEAAFEEAVR